MDGIVPRTKEMDLAEFGGEGKWTIRAMSNGVRKKMKREMAEIGLKNGYSIKDLNDQEVWEGLLYLYGDEVLTDAICTCIIAGPGVVDGKMHPVAHCHRISTADALQTEITLYLTINQLAIVCTDGVPAACILNDESLHCGEHQAIKQS